MPQALTEREKAKTRQYLGYFNLANRSVINGGMPLVTYQSGVLEMQMENILDEYSIEIVREILEDIECSRIAIKKAKKTLKLKSVAYAAEFNPFEISQLWQEDYKLCAQLAQLINAALVWHPTGRGLMGSGGTIQILG